ncbi:hypothetical protein MSAN_01930000 [Mycena sanguinolenta]|uniref:Uncharacterized protein n=1 Tax=Mycena sanguinolenta TaxID=230812 RepID=A0A8H6XQ52_9AGAR|nr:hypothetical protein MSAN_01930000 [Mycena sanguinolenta]
MCRMLEYLHFECAARSLAPNLPHLPALRVLELTFLGIRRGIAGVISQTADILSSLVFPEMLPALAEAKIEQHFAKNGVFNPAPYAPLMALLETAYAAYRNPSCIRWLLVTSNKDNAQFTNFADTEAGDAQRTW